MLIINVALFGMLGLTVWAVQMLWIPFWAAGVVNGIGHFWGYRNFEATDASTNLIPWGIIVGGEELHNNHHTYPTSAKFSVKKYEFDIGWVYISLMQKIGWAKVKKLPPKMQLGDVVPVANEKTLEAVDRQPLRSDGRLCPRNAPPTREELAQLKAKGADLSVLKAAKNWPHRDDDKVPAAARPNLVQARAAPPGARQDGDHARRAAPVAAQHLATRANSWRPTSRPGATRAEASGIAGLREFSTRLRAARA